MFGTYCTLSPDVLKHAAVCHNAMTQRKHCTRTKPFVQFLRAANNCSRGQIVFTGSLVQSSVWKLRLWQRNAETCAAERSCGGALSLQTTLLSGADYLKLCLGIALERPQPTHRCVDALYEQFSQPYKDKLFGEITQKQPTFFGLFEFSLLLMQLRFIRRCSFLCAWIIQHCSLSALVVRCMVKNQWRERLSAWGQALFSTPAAKRTSYVRVGGWEGGGGAQSTTSTAWQLLSLCHRVFTPCFPSLSVLTWPMPRLL